IVVDGDGAVLIEAENGYMPDHDGTAHAERLAATQACRTLGREVLAKATLYSSAEPCAMCAGAIYWAGIGRVVYGLSEHRLRGAIVVHLETIRWLELHRDTAIHRRFGAGLIALTVEGAGNAVVVVEAELVLPVAVGNPEIDEVRVLRTPDRLGGVEGQTDRFRIELDFGV